MNAIFEAALFVAEQRKKQALSELRGFTARLFVNQFIPVEPLVSNIAYPIPKLIFTSSTGTYLLLDERRCIKLLDGKFYGMTRFGDYWLLAHSNNRGKRDFLINERLSTILLIQIANDAIQSIRPLIWGIPSEIHQIDTFGQQLLFPHTGYNQVLTLNLSEIIDNNPSFISACTSYPLYLLSAFSHLNSIFVQNDAWHIIAHNYTFKSGKLSDYLIYNPLLKAFDCFALNAHSAHNIYVDSSGAYFYLDSNRGHFKKNTQVVFTSPKFLRGLAVHEDLFIIGGSDINFSGYQRFSNTPTIYFIDKKTYHVLNSLKFPDIGDIYEIRLFNQPDYALSNTNT